MKDNLLSNILIKPQVITASGIKYLLDTIKRSSTQDLSVFDPDLSNRTKQTKFSVDKQIRDTQLVDAPHLMPDIIELYQNIVKQIINPSYGFEIRDSEAPQILSYSPGGHYKPHVDGESLWKAPDGEVFWRKSTDRDLSTVLFLNDDFEGGDFVFPELHIKITPEPGMLICFPSTHHYLHGVEPVLAGRRYSMVNWMTIKGFPTLAEETEIINKKYGIRS